MAKNKTAPVWEQETKPKSFLFPSADEARIAYKQACDLVEDKFFMHHETLVKISGSEVTVPSWFPYRPKNEKI